MSEPTEISAEAKTILDYCASIRCNGSYPDPDAEAIIQSAITRATAAERKTIKELKDVLQIFYSYSVFPVGYLKLGGEAFKTARALLAKTEPKGEDEPCDHREHDHGICLCCGEDINDDLQGAADAMMDSTRDKEKGEG